MIAIEVEKGVPEGVGSRPRCSVGEASWVGYQPPHACELFCDVVPGLKRAPWR